jgi:hypothetical protein
LVNQAAAGLDNYVIMKPLGTAASWTSLTQCYLEVREIGSQFQTSNNITAPTWETATGLVVEP